MHNNCIQLNIGYNHSYVPYTLPTILPYMPYLMILYVLPVLDHADNDRASSSPDQLHPDSGQLRENSAASKCVEVHGLLLMWLCSIDVKVAPG